MSVEMQDIHLVYMMPEILVAVMAMALLLLSAWTHKGGAGVVHWLTVLTIVGVILVIHVGEGTGTTFGGQFVTDAMSRYMKVLMCLGMIIPVIMSRDYIRAHAMDGGEYHVVSMFAMLGGMILASSGGFVILYLGLELMSLSFYVLAAWRRDDVRSGEAGLKYFVLGSMASGLLLYGISMIYGATGGATGFKEVAALLATPGIHDNQLLVLGMVMVLAGMGFKVAAAPFHMWAPDVYQGAPTPVTAFMAVMPKVAAFAALFRLVADVFAPAHGQWVGVLQLFAILSMATGAFAGLVQTDLKRLLAYSSIGHVGYILIGLVSNSAAGMQGVMVYLTIYLFMTVGVFAIIISFDRQGLGENIRDYQGLAHKQPLVAFVLAMFMFSMAGIPPLAGFIGKLNIFMAAVKAGLVPLAVLGVLFSAVSAFYYLRVVKVMYFDPADRESRVTFSGGGFLVVTMSMVLILMWGILPGDLLTWTASSVQTWH
ncbi:MAG: NADH-quinone oxidoreductase subunit NuoN [Magnetococcales bacterium]|nr:NADH-quinone oxidoreductase subunit NuoN [Magnetococcales bacterium]